MLRMTILGLGASLIFGTADLQAQVDPDQSATQVEQDDARPGRDSDRARRDNDQVRPDTRPDVRRPTIDRRPAPTRGRRDVRPMRTNRR